MARAVREANLATRTSRARLKPRKKPYWRALDRGLHLGYYRGVKGGRWIGRRYAGDQRYQEQALGTADDVQDADGVGILDYSQAQAKAREWSAEQQGGGPEALAARRAPVTVGEALDDYLIWYEKNRKSARDTRYTVEAHIRPALGDYLVKELTAPMLRQWQEALAEQPAKRRTAKGRSQKLAAVSGDEEIRRARRSSANRILTVLKAALNKSFHDGRVESDSAWRKVKPFRGVDASRLRYLATDECRRLLNACPSALRVLVRAALETGARYGELCRAAVADFDADAGTLFVRESKSGKPRHVPLDRAGRAFMEQVTAGRSPTELIFRREDGGAWGKSHQQRPLLEACERARIQPAASFHILRHTYASQRIMNGAPLMVIAQALGHSDTRMVEKHYGHLAQGYVQQVIEATGMDLEDDAVGSRVVMPLRLG